MPTRVRASSRATPGARRATCITGAKMRYDCALTLIKCHPAPDDSIADHTEENAIKFGIEVGFRQANQAERIGKNQANR